MATPPALTHFSWVLQAFFLKEGFHTVVNMGGRSKKHYGVVIHYPVVFLVRLGPNWAVSHPGLDLRSQDPPTEVKIGKSGK